MAEREWDAIVVGAGVIGCAAAWELGRRGARTLIIEARTAGAGATQASAGILAPYIEAPDGGPLHALTVESLSLYDAFVADAGRDAGRPIEYRRCGTIEVAQDAASAARLAALGEWIRSTGVSAEWIGMADAHRLEPALGAVDGALVVPVHGYVRALQMTMALLDAARAHGVVFDAGRRATAVHDSPSGAVVEAEGGSYRGRTAVIAAGSWSSQLAPAVDVRPVRGQLVQLGWTGAPITHVLWSDRCYVVPWMDGTLLVGATVEEVGFDERVTAGGVQALLDAARALLPGAVEAAFLGARVGLRPATPTGLPHVSRADGSSIVYATGHYRNGILLAPLTARRVAALVLGR